jgi:SAM-dependent methyltransferase
MKWIAKSLIESAIASLPGTDGAIYFLQRRVTKSVPGSLSLDRPLTHVHGLKQQGYDLRDQVILELGTGWVPAAPVVFHLVGAQRICLTDLQRHLRKENVIYCLENIDRFVDDIAVAARQDREEVATRARLLVRDESRELDELLAAMRMEYRAPFDARRTDFPAQTFDLISSTSVLQMIPPEMLEAILIESHRVLKPGGVMSHVVPHRDPFMAFGAPPMNFLRYSDLAWHALAPSPRVHVNRMREFEYLELLEKLDFEIVHTSSVTFPEDRDALRRMQEQPTARLAPRFMGIELEKLAVGQSHIIARKR